VDRSRLNVVGYTARGTPAHGAFRLKRKMVLVYFRSLQKTEIIRKCIIDVVS